MNRQATTVKVGRVNVGYHHGWILINHNDAVGILCISDGICIQTLDLSWIVDCTHGNNKALGGGNIHAAVGGTTTISNLKGDGGGPIGVGCCGIGQVATAVYGWTSGE